MTDESVDIFYSCILCQSFAPDHVCIISPERLGLCGAYNWLDCKASYEINPTGPNQPIVKGEVIDPVLGYWKGTNEYALQASHGSVGRVALYSIMNNPMTACGCFECIAMLIPEANGVMVVSREDVSMTPAGMKFSTLAGICGGGLQTPGLMGIGKYYLTSRKFLSADGGFKRIVWLSANLKESMADELQAVAEREGDPDLISRIADGTSVTEVDELVKWLKEHDHPALKMPPMQPAPEPEEVPEAVAIAAAAGAAAPTPAPAAASTEAAPEPAPASATVEPEPQPEPEPAPAVPEPVTPTTLPASTDIQAIAEMSANIILDKLRSALAAAFRELGGAVPAAPTAAPPAVQAPAPAEEKAPTKAEEAPPPKPKVVRPKPLAAPWIKDPSSGLELVHEKWTGKVLEITLGATNDTGGSRAKTLTIGGETTLPYMFTEGQMPHKPAVAIEIADQRPSDWSQLLVDAWDEVMDDSAAWARAAEARGADAILLRLSATQPDGQPNTAARARETVRKVLNATGLPLIVYGPGQAELDNDLLVAVAEEGKGERLVLGLCEEKNYRTIVAAALANDHLVIASTAMDVNLAKQLNILISDMGLPLNRILMDPTCAGVGYGIEYGYSVMERLRLAALTGDRMTQLPMIVTVGYEAWRQKEAKAGEGVPEAWGDWHKRAINWETLTAASLVESGADLLVLRHPESVQRIHTMIDELMAGNQGG